MKGVEERHWEEGVKLDREGIPTHSLTLHISKARIKYFQEKYSN